MNIEKKTKLTSTEELLAEFDELNKRRWDATNRRHPPGPPLPDQTPDPRPPPGRPPAPTWTVTSLPSWTVLSPSLLPCPSLISRLLPAPTAACQPETVPSRRGHGRFRRLPSSLSCQECPGCYSWPAPCPRKGDELLELLISNLTILAWTLMTAPRLSRPGHCGGPRGARPVPGHCLQPRGPRGPWTRGCHQHPGVPEWSQTRHYHCGDLGKRTQGYPQVQSPRHGADPGPGAGSFDDFDSKLAPLHLNRKHLVQTSQILMQKTN